MAQYSSVEESWERHKDFVFDTQEERKYERKHFGFNRVEGLLKRVPEGSLVLEMGCNSGGFSMLLMKERYCFCHGVDVAPRMIQRALAKGLNVKLYPAEETGYKDEKFDVVVASELLEHVFDPEVVLREAWRVLRPGGKLVGSVPHPKSMNSKKMEVVEHHYHCRIFTQNSLKETLSGLFKDVEMEAVPYKNETAGGEHVSPVARRMIKNGTPQWFVFSGVKCAS